VTAAPSLRTQALTAAALVAFAGNSLLARPALGRGLIDAASYTAVRVASGALMLAILLQIPARRIQADQGDWTSAGALFLYAIAFSGAYLLIPAGLGALILFGAVQITMIGWGLVRGERPGAIEWIGVGTAIAGLTWLTLAPGVVGSDLRGAVMMTAAGGAWGIYSLRGRGNADPLGATAGNFLRSIVFAGAAVAIAGRHLRVTPEGIGLACASGAIASGLGYTIWYAALPGLTALRAAAAQLAVPVLAGVGGVVLLGERVTARLVAAGILILGGVALALFGRRLMLRS
jgi:drug/metabolite transporter (DMT)-like permease